MQARVFLKVGASISTYCNNCSNPNDHEWVDQCLLKGKIGVCKKNYNICIVIYKLQNKSLQINCNKLFFK